MSVELSELGRDAATIMGSFQNRAAGSVFIWTLVLLIVALNLLLPTQLFGG